MTYKRKPPYTPQEDALIIAGTITDDALAKMLGRSEVAIRVRRQTVRDRDRQGDVKPRGWVPTLEEIEERKKTGVGDAKKENGASAT